MSVMYFKFNVAYLYLCVYLLLSTSITCAQVPSSITGLKLWLKADSAIVLNGSNVAAWNDCSTNNNNATQATTSQQPTFVTNVLNGRPAVFFNGGTLLNGGAIANLSSSSLSVYVVASGGAMNNNYNVLFSLGAFGPGGLWLSKNSQRYTIYSNNVIYATPQVTLTDTGFNPKIFGFNKDFGINANSYLNTALVANATGINFTGAFGNGNYGVGADPTYPGGLWSGNVFEIILFDKLVSNAENTLINNYLINKYAPTLNLGPDVAVPATLGCMPSVPTTLTANADFKKYLWNTGDTLKQINVNQYGTYSVITTDVFDVKHYDTINVTPPPLFYNYPSTTVCAGSSVVWNTNLAHANYNFLWSNGSTDSLLNITSAGNYSVQITDVKGCVYTSNNTTFSTDTFPTYATLGADTALCVGNSIQLKKGAAQAVSYLWNTAATTPSITIATGGQYTLQAHNSNGCVVKDTINITLLGTAPTTNFTYTNNCKGNSINCTNTSAPPAGASIIANNWTINYNGITGNSTNFNPIVNDTLTYLVSLYTSSSNGCSNSVQKNIKVYNQPKVSITTLNSCTNDSTQLKAFPVLQGNMFDYYKWTTPNAAIIITANNSIKQYITSVGNSAYTLQIFSTNGCSTTATKNVYTYQAPNVAIDVKSNCANSTVSFKDNTNYNGPYTVLNGKWNIQGVDSTNYSNYYFKKLAQGNYIVTLSIQASNGCKAKYTRGFSVYDLPIANYTVRNNCTLSNALFSYANTPTNAPINQYNWVIGTANINTASSVNYLINTALDSLPVTLTVTDTNNCKGIISTKIKVYEAPKAMFTNSYNPNYDLPTTLYFTNISTNATQYNWVVNNVPASNSGLNYALTANTATNYNVKLIAKNAAQCADSTVQRFQLAKRINNIMVSAVSVIENNGYAQVTCLLTNLGTRNLQRAQLYAQVAGNDAVNEEWQGSIASGASVLYTLTSKLHINLFKKYNDAVCVWALLPNDFDDDETANNRACVALATQDDFKLSTIYQNPENKSITLTVITKTPIIAHLTIHDMSGKIILENTNLNLPQTYNEVFIDLTKFATGIYKYSIYNGTQQLTGSFYTQ